MSSLLHPSTSIDRRVTSRTATTFVAGLSGLRPAPLSAEMSHLPNVSHLAEDVPDAQPALVAFDDPEAMVDLLRSQTPPPFSPRSDWSATLQPTAG